MAEALSRRAPRFVFLSEVASRDGAGRVGWRLVAANNRPLGRATLADESYEACRAAALQVHRRAAEAARSAAFDVPTGRWTWSVALDGTPVAVCAHPYLRRVECIRALSQFLEAAQLADPDDGVLRYFGPNSLREYRPVAAGALAGVRT